MTDGARAVAVAVDLTVDNDARARRRRSNGVASASGRRESAVVLLSDGEDDARAPPAPTTGRATTTATKKRRRSVGDVVVVRETRDAGPIVLTGTPRGDGRGAGLEATRRRSRAKRRAEVLANGGVDANARVVDESGGASDGTGGKCAVCLEAYVNPTVTRCGHLFCQKCLQAAIKHSSKCPTCRKKVTKSQIHRVYM
jgi:hypothetical protein